MMQLHAFFDKEFNVPILHFNAKTQSRKGAEKGFKTFLLCVSASSRLCVVFPVKHSGPSSANNPLIHSSGCGCGSAALGLSVVEAILLN